MERSRESQPRKQRGSPGRHEWLYRKGSAMLLQRQAEDDAWARRKEEEELAECTFKPKINKVCASFLQQADGGHGLIRARYWLDAPTLQASKDLVSLKYSQDGSFYDRQVSPALLRPATQL